MTVELLDRPIAFQRAYVRLGIGITGSLMLSQAVYWSNRTRDAEGWFYKDQREWEEETGLTRREQETARKRLIEAGFISEERRGVPCRLFYKINLEALNKALSQIAPKSQSSMAESANLDCTKAPNCDGGMRQPITEITTEITPESTQNPVRTLDDEKPKPKPKAKRQPKPETTITEYIENCKAAGVKAIPPSHGVFKDAEESLVPPEFLELAWFVFRDDMAAKGKTQKDWPGTFRIYMNKGWINIWAISSTGEYYLNTAGKQAQIKYRGSL